MNPRRVCSECGETLAGRDTRAKTCCDAHRAARSRRLKRQKTELSEAGAAARRLPDHQRTVAKAARDETVDLARDVIVDELRPIVRDAITEDTLWAIRGLVGLTPRVVELISDDLDSEDDAVRQRAYTLVAKYTFGHPAFIRPEEEGTGQQLVVNFALPRPGDVVEFEQPIDMESDEIRQCDTCNEDKPIMEFVANSHRCVSCHNAFVARAQAITEKSG